MSTRLIVVLATAGIVIVGVLVGSVGAEQTALPAGNLVKNPGAEAGPGATTTAQRSGETATFNPPGWTTDRLPVSNSGSDAFIAARYGSHGYFPSKEVSAKVGGGKNFFYGGYPPKSSTATQTIDVTRAGAEIDSGGVKACLSGYIGGSTTPTYTMRVELQLLGEDESVLGRLSIGPVPPAQRNNETTLGRRAAEKAAMSGTRLLRVVMAAGSPCTGAIYAYADNISVGLTNGACEAVLAVRCVNKALVATVTPSSIAKTQRVRFAVKGGKRTKQANDARVPYTSRFTMDGLTGTLTVTATVTQADSGPIALTRKSKRC